MTNDSEQKLPTTWTDVAKSLAEGGVPQILAGPAGKALSRLIAGATDIPAAWLEKQAQRIKDDTAARTTIVGAIAKATASAAVADPALLDRALHRHVSEIYRAQENREAVAEKTIAHLTTDPVVSTSEGPTDDWMNVFDGYAAKASSDELRETWARVLAGEIRKPASFSLQTLQFISVLDGPTAIAAEVLLSRTVDRRYALLGETITGELFDQMHLVRTAGLIGQLNADTTTRKRIGENGVAIFCMADQGIVARGTPNAEIPVSCTLVTIIGQELHPVVQPQASAEATDVLIEQLKRSEHVQTILRGVWVSENGMIVVHDAVEVWERPPQN
ncbi:hypothetical protein FHT87_004604 [Rhizobium sp. BK316]|uniref:DUF2806 domain-containing protein n=1 Tax=Rhizobium sp. BK316 TaxID=2587053 RepID=UPI00160D731D|nr:DUF2806 domain-containing protein [Rhizobium sp. BK316]MBB3410672.1 hypothetical protein [Rhizobium sp. BK316]